MGQEQRTAHPLLLPLVKHFLLALFPYVRKNLKGTQRPDEDEACSAAENQGGLHTEEELKNNKQNDRLIIS